MKISIAVAAAWVALPFASTLAAAPESPHDIAFVHQAADGGMAEVQEGRMAISQAASPDVKQFGQQMINDHTPNDQALTTLAQQKGIKLPPSLDTKHQEEVAALQKLNGSAFDAAYLKAQIIGHRQMADIMTMEIQTGKDADLKAFAQKTLPTVQQHLKMAQQLQAKN